MSAECEIDLNFTEEESELLPKEFPRWSDDRKAEWLYYTAAHFRKDRWDNDRMFAHYDGTNQFLEDLRFAYIVCGWEWDDSHARLPFIEIKPKHVRRWIDRQRKERDKHVGQR